MRLDIVDEVIGDITNSAFNTVLRRDIQKSQNN
jgi:hypothetical protein